MCTFESRFAGDAIDPLTFPVEPVVRTQVEHERDQQQPDRHADGKADDVDRREKLVAHEAASRCFDVASDHNPVDKKVDKFWSSYRITSEELEGIDNVDKLRATRPDGLLAGKLSKVPKNTGWIVQEALPAPVFYPYRG